MKKAILDKSSQQFMIDRVYALTPSSKGLWGMMTVNDMLFHCAEINADIVRGKPANRKPTLKQQALRILVLSLMKSIPKGIKTKPKYIKPKEDSRPFEDLHKSLIDSVCRFAEHEDEIHGNHPIMGPLKTTQWRRFVYMHMDYHLRQFGV